MEIHKCQSCGRDATVHLTEIVQGKMTEVHYCDECAQKEGVSPLTPQSFFAQLVGPGSSSGKDAELTCGGCGLTYAEFRQRGRLGCPECYRVFREGLCPLLEKIHGSSQHLGRVPGSTGEGLKAERELIQLRRELSRAIQREEYEKAAEIRDRIQELEEPKAVESD
jgi:protein arginine kinase activator